MEVKTRYVRFCYKNSRYGAYKQAIAKLILKKGQSRSANVSQCRLRPLKVKKAIVIALRIFQILEVILGPEVTSKVMDFGFK